MLSAAKVPQQVLLQQKLSDVQRRWAVEHGVSQPAAAQVPQVSGWRGMKVAVL